jgi:hypothetical protein
LFQIALYNRNISLHQKIGLALFPNQTPHRFSGRKQGLDHIRPAKSGCPGYKDHTALLMDINWPISI